MALQNEIPDELDALVLGRWAEDRALVQLPGGTVVTTSVPDHLREAFDVGRRVTMTADGDHLVACDRTSRIPMAYGTRRGFRRTRLRSSEVL